MAVSAASAPTARRWDQARTRALVERLRSSLAVASAHHRQLAEEDPLETDASSRAPSPRQLAGQRASAAPARGRAGDLHWTDGGRTRQRPGAVRAAAQSSGQFDLTVHFLGGGQRRAAEPARALQIHRPLFSSAPALPLASPTTPIWRPGPLLTSRLRGYDVIHTTDGSSRWRTAARLRWPASRSPTRSTPPRRTTRVFTAVTVRAPDRRGRGFPDAPERGVARAAEAACSGCSTSTAAAAHRARLARRRSRGGRAAGAERWGCFGAASTGCSTGRRDRQWPRLGIPPDRRLVISVGRLDPIRTCWCWRRRSAAQRWGRKPAPALRRKGPDRTP